MNKIGKLALATALLLSSPAYATRLNCDGASNIEEFRYSWRLRGGIRFVAGLFFPTTGVANLKTVFSKAGNTSELLITAPEGSAGGYFAYESEMDASGQTTLMTYSGYAWGGKHRNERAKFDYGQRVARIHKVTPNKVEDKVKPIPSAQMRDVLTAIYFLRQNAANIKAPIVTKIYSEGKEYPVVFRPADRKSFVIEGKRVSALGFEIVDAPGGKKWPGGVKVWLSEDARRIPFRIEIHQSLATVQLDLDSIESCAFMQARR